MMASSMRQAETRQQQQTNQQSSQQNGAEESLQDLSLQSLQWLESRGLYDNNSRQDRNSRRASLPEQIQANGYYRSVTVQTYTKDIESLGMILGVFDI